jgi:hypothetical protein
MEFPLKFLAGPGVLTAGAGPGAKITGVCTALVCCRGAPEPIKFRLERDLGKIRTTGKCRKRVLTTYVYITYMLLCQCYTDILIVNNRP